MQGEVTRIEEVGRQIAFGSGKVTGKSEQTESMGEPQVLNSKQQGR